MAEIINLRRHRKARMRADEAAQAEANRAKFGRTPAERAQARAEQAQRDRRLDAVRLEGEGPEDVGDTNASFAPPQGTD